MHILTRYADISSYKKRGRKNLKCNKSLQIFPCCGEIIFVLKIRENSSLLWRVQVRKRKAGKWAGWKMRELHLVRSRSNPRLPVISRRPFQRNELGKFRKAFRVAFAASGGFSDYFSFCQSFAFYFPEKNTQFVFKRLKIYLYLLTPNKFANGFCLSSIFRVGKNGKSNKLKAGEGKENVKE